MRTYTFIKNVQESEHFFTIVRKDLFRAHFKIMMYDTFLDSATQVFVIPFFYNGNKSRQYKLHNVSMLTSFN